MSQDLRSTDRLADRIRLHRQVDRRPIVVGEGHSDRRHLDRILPAGSYVYFLGSTRVVVLNAARDLHALRVAQVACVVDRDFDDDVATFESDGLPIAAYDDADLEAMLWGTSALEDLLAEFGSSGKLQAVGGVGQVRRMAAEVLQPVQRLRRANAIHGWGLNFDGLDLRARIRQDTLVLSVQSLCDALWSTDLGIPKRVLYDAAVTTETPSCPSTGRTLARGRDLLAVLAVALRRRLGGLSLAQTDPEHLAQTLRLAASPVVAAETRWRSSLARFIGL